MISMVGGSAEPMPWSVGISFQALVNLPSEYHNKNLFSSCADDHGGQNIHSFMVVDCSVLIITVCVNPGRSGRCRREQGWRCQSRK